MVIGPANHGYALVALVKEHCTAMGFRVSRSMLQHGSRKGGACGAWFSELAKKEFGGQKDTKKPNTNPRFPYSVKIVLMVKNLILALNGLSRSSRENKSAQLLYLLDLGVKVP